jgi:hypothetical protein
LNSLQHPSEALASKWISIFKIIASIIFPAYCLLIDSNIQYAQDDFTLMQTVREQGNSLNAAIWFYSNYEGSFLMFLREYSFFYFPKFIFLLLTLSLHLLALWFFIHSLFLFFKTKISLLDSWVIASVFSGGLYVLSMDASGVYHWLAGSTYLCSLTYALWASGFMLRKKPLLALPFFIFLMQSRINFSALVFGVYFLFFAYNYYINKAVNKRVLYSLLLMLLTLIIYVIAPGNWIRTVTHEQTLDDGIVPAMKLVFIKEYLFHLPHALIFSSFIALILPEGIAQKIRLKGYKIAFPLLAVVGLAITNMVIMQVTTHTYYYGNRVWLLNTFAFLFAVCYYTIISLDWLKTMLNSKTIAIMTYLGTSCLCIVVSFIFFGFGKTNYPLGKTYAKEFENMIHNVQKAKGLGKSDTLWVPFLPNPGVLRYHKMVPLPKPLPEGYPFEIGVIHGNFAKYNNVPFCVLMTNDKTLLDSSREFYK